MNKISKIILSLLVTGLALQIQAAPIESEQQNQNVSTQDVEMIANEILKGMSNQAAGTTSKTSSDESSEDSSSSTENQSQKKSTPIGPAVGYVPEEAITKFKQSQNKSTTEKKVNQLYKQAFQKENMGATGDSLRLLTQALKLNPKHQQVRLAKGRLQVKVRQYAAAEKTLLQLCTLDNNQWQPWYWTGSAQLMMGELSKAEKSLDEALAREGTQATLWLNRALVEQERGDHDSALQLLAIANDLAPKDPHVLLNVAYSSEAIGDIHNARSAYRKFLSEAKTDPNTTQLKHTVLSHLSQLKISSE